MSLASSYRPLLAAFTLLLVLHLPATAATVTVENRVMASTDDAEESAHGKVSVDDWDLDLTYDRTSQLVGMRWTGLALPQGATITAAYIQFTARIANSEATSLTIAAQASDNPPGFVATNSNLWNRVLGPAVSWNPPAWTVAGAAGVEERTPDLTAVIQQIVNRPGWVTGNSIVILIGGSGLRTAWAYDGNAAAAPLLHVEYSVPDPVGPPEQIHWTIMGQTAVTFDWASGSDTLRYGLTSSYGQIAIASAPNPMPFSSPGPFREAKLTNLTPNTTYHYSISGSADHTFRTPPPRGAADFTVVAQGDIGAAEDWPQVAPIQARIATLNPAFVLMIGDLTYADDLGQQAVDAHFNDMMVWSRDAAYMPAWGNHEWGVGTDDLRNYKGRFDLPNPQGSVNSPAPGCCTEDWSWFDYGNVRFISYPEPYSGAWNEWGTRAAPIMDAAQADTAIDYIITFGHQPAFSSGYHVGYPGMQTIMAGLAANHSKYVLNLNGHSHNYERSYPQSGVVHITAGTGGSTLELGGNGNCIWEGGCPAPSWSAFRAMHHVVFQLRFTPTAIEGKAYCGPAQPGKNDITCIEGTILDSFSIPNPTVPPSMPTAQLTVTPPNGSAPLSVTANASGSSDPDGSIVSYRFDFGDGTIVGPQAQATANHTYGVGTFTVSVTVTDNAANTATASAQVISESASTPNLIGNPSFETSTSGWGGYNSASLTRVAGTHDGLWACRMSATAPGSFGINDSPAWVPSIPSSGMTYRFGAWVRSSTSVGSARLRVTEYLGTTKIGETLLSTALTLSPVWQQLSMDFVTGAAGSWLDYQVINVPIGSGEVFEVDALSIRVPGSSVGVDDLPLERATVSALPSPMKGPGTIAFTSTRAGAARVEVFDLSGRRVAQLLDTPRIDAGRHAVRLGREAPGALPAGVYLYRVSLDEAVLSGRFVLLP